MADGLKQNQDAARSAKAIILYVITQNGKEAGKYSTFFRILIRPFILAIDLKNEPFTVYEGDVKNGEKATATVTVDDEDFVKIASGQLAPQKVGKTRIKL